MLTCSPLKDPAPDLEKVPFLQGRGLAPLRHRLKEARKGVAPGPPLVAAKKDVLDRTRLKGLGFCGVKKGVLDPGILLHYTMVSQSVKSVTRQILLRNVLFSFSVLFKFAYVCSSTKSFNWSCFSLFVSFCLNVGAEAQLDHPTLAQAQNRNDYQKKQIILKLHVVFPTHDFVILPLPSCSY